MGRDEREQRKAAKLEKQRNRQVKIAVEPGTNRVPKVPSVEDANQAQVVWSFYHFDNEDWRHSDTDWHVSFAEVAERLGQYSRRTWAEIASDPKRDHPCEPASLCPEAQRKLLALGFDTVDQVFRFRFDGTQRLWGFRDRQYFIALWWDPDHQVYPVELKNT